MPDDVYTHGHHDSVLRSHRWRTAENSAGYLLPRLRPGMEVLDVGCGPGTITVDLAARVGSGRVVGIDRSEDVVAEARAAGVNASRPVEFAVGDVYALDFPDDSFDVVHAHQVLQHLSDPVPALGEMRRVCRPGGVVAVRDSDYSSFGWGPLDSRLDDWLATYRALAKGNDAEPDAGRFLLGWAHQAGFGEVDASASVWCFATAADREWWGELWADRVQASAFAGQAIERGLADADTLADWADAFRTWASSPDGCFTVVHGEILATA